MFYINSFVTICYKHINFCFVCDFIYVVECFSGLIMSITSITYSPYVTFQQQLVNSNLPIYFKTAPYSSDRVEINKPQEDTPAINKKNGLSNGAKIGLGALTLIGIGAVAYILTNGKVGNKSVQQLAEHIEFKKANNIEEAIEFGKTHLGIKDYSGFSAKDIDVMNWINEGMVNISNKLKGKIKTPKNIHYEAIDGQTMLQVTSDGQCLTIDKLVFEDIDKAINNYLKDGSWITIQNGKFAYPEIYSSNTIKELLQKLHKFNNNQCNFNEKIELFENLQMATAETNSFLLNPINKIKTILNNSSAKERLTSLDLEVDINKIAKMTTDEQQTLLMQYIKEANIKKPLVLSSRFKSIYHEFGHLNDPDISKRSCLKAFYDKNKSSYPKELREWLGNKQKIKVAGEISSYATENPAEFLAETYAHIIEGRKVSDDVLALYKEYGGILP